MVDKKRTYEKGVVNMSCLIGFETRILGLGKEVLTDTGIFIEVEKDVLGAFPNFSCFVFYFHSIA